MAAGKHGSAEITIAYDDAPGGVLRTITSFVLTMGAVKITSNMQGATPYGASVESHATDRRQQDRPDHDPRVLGRQSRRADRTPCS
jgi:hypothetical protein